MLKQLINELDYGMGSTMPPSKAILFPHVRMAHSMVKQAVVELREHDVLIALQALAWWLSDDAEDWLMLLDLGQPGDDYFCKLIKGCQNAKTYQIS
jgi:hypothetical protein